LLGPRDHECNAARLEGGRGLEMGASDPGTVGKTNPGRVALAEGELGDIRGQVELRAVTPDARGLRRDGSRIERRPGR
jgi:hypothetical protein